MVTLPPPHPMKRVIKINRINYLTVSTEGVPLVGHTDINHGEGFACHFILC